MGKKVQNLSLEVAAYHEKGRLDIFKGELPWSNGRRKQAEASISLEVLGIDNAVIGISCSHGVLNTLGGFAVFSSGGQDEICCSFCCLPKSSQSLRFKIGDHVVEVMLTNNGDRI